MARPIPPAPPVTTATAPRRSFIVGIVTWSRIPPQAVVYDHRSMPPRPSPDRRVVKLFEHLAGEGRDGLTLAEVSRCLNVHKASCHSMLAELLQSRLAAARIRFADVSPGSRAGTPRPGGGGHFPALALAARR